MPLLRPKIAGKARPSANKHNKHILYTLIRDNIQDIANKVTESHGVPKKSS